jgi:hypothetical protein
VAASSQAPAQQQPTKPNILFIMGDDIGWMQPSIYHRGLMVGETPNIDRMVRTSPDLTHHELIVHCRLYISLATASARVHPARSPCASSRLARARVVANCARARSLARLIEAGVGCRSI